MTKREYADYERRVAEFMEGEQLCGFSVIGDEENGYSEPNFSWQSCDCCDSGLGVDRYEVYGLPSTDATKGKCGAVREQEYYREYRICSDCYYYAEDGRLDDQTMWEVEHDTSTDESEEG